MKCIYYSVIALALMPLFSLASQSKLPAIKQPKYSGVPLAKPKKLIVQSATPVKTKEEPPKKVFVRRSRCTETIEKPSSKTPVELSYMQDYIHISNLLSKPSWGDNPQEIQKAILRKIEQTKKLINYGSSSTIATFLPLFNELQMHPKLNQKFDTSTDKKTR